MEGKALPNGQTRAHTSKRGRRALVWVALVATLVLALILLLPAAGALAAPVTQDGTSHTGSTATGSSITFSHTAGTGANRLLLVGISWNCGTTNRTISSVTWNGTPLTEVTTQLGYNSSNPRYSAIYKLVAPASGVTGNVVVTFSGAVSNGAIAGAANFANVDQTTPLGTAAGAGSATSDTTATVNLTGLLGTELVFDNVFMGSSNTATTLTVGANQSSLWNVNGYTGSGNFNVFAGASTEQATSSSVTMSWTISASARWAIAAVPIRPAPAGPDRTLTMAVSPSGGGTTDPVVGPHTYSDGTVVNISATPNSGYVFANWTGGSVANPNSATTTVAMDADKTVTANFYAIPAGTIVRDGAVSSSTADDVSSISFSHTTGTGSSRLLVVGVSWNGDTTARTISSVTFTPSGGSAQNLTAAVSHKHSTQNRYAALYYLVNPGSGVTGTVAITFSGSVASGIVAGATNFAGVDQTTPIGVTNFADSGSNQNTASSVTLSGLAGNELVIDDVFQGASDSSQTLTVGAGQTQLWNNFAGNTRAAASTEQAGGSSVTMSWTAASSSYWDIVAAAIKPVPAPTVSSLSPTSGTTAGGTPVTITGTNLTGATAVSFGGTPATSVVAVDATTVTCTSPAGSGTVDVTVTTPGGTSATNPSDQFTYVVPGPTRYDQTNGNIVYSGAWAPYTKTAAYNGTYGRSSTSGASATIYFKGTRLDWIGMKGTTTGYVDVYLDGVKKTTINLNASAATYQVMLWSTGDLTSGVHAVRLVRSSSSASGKFIVVDAVDVWGELIPGPTRYDQTNTKIVYSGSWAPYTKSAAYNGSYGRSSTSGASATIYFTGTLLNWIGMKGTTTGIVEVWVDGALKETVDLTATTAAYQVNLFSTGTLPDAPHTVKLVRSDSSAAGKFIVLDAVDIFGTLTNAPV
jgi:uncharacterized repeat protein (TIGR02543 family)